MKLKQIAAAVIAAYASRAGLMLGAITAEVDEHALAALPESQRGWYEADAAKPGSFKVNLARVDIEDVTGLKSTVAATRKEAADAKAAATARITAMEELYKGIDPVKTRAMLAKFDNEEEAGLIAAGKIDEVLTKRMAKRDADTLRQITEAQGREAGALEVASTFMERVLDNEIRSAVNGCKGFHAPAVEDALLRARGIFSLSDDGKAVRLAEDGETPVFGKDGKTAFSPTEWIESMRETAPHWFISGGSGGGAGGGKNIGGGQDLSGLSPTARLTAARAAQNAGK